ncbi:MFS general substrate transporter [Aulographum hederae CBS 113979]|uniref:MFS general substrate transporter n=1 Tax=Aulographum hederae CBS 113979 TaxID=1176131 RepID=A0A6G1GW62_9PEZI|nr:MFS general substrate transporter [Aulographum hederae CBS 113979]
MQSSATENTPLLGESSNQGLEAPVYSTSSAVYGEAEEEPIHALITRYGSPGGGSLGLSGGIGIFGTSLTRRGSTVSLPPTTDTLRRPSRPTIQYRKPSLSPVLERSKHDDILNDSDDLSQDPEEHRRPTKFLYGVRDSQFWSCFIGVALVCFVACFDSTLMASSHPVITSYFDASNSASWLSTSFLLTSTAFQPMFGRISDTVGRKGPFVFSLTAFLLGTLWCALARSILQFILARAICGLGAAGALAMGTIIISDLVPLEARGGYLSFLNLASGVGSSLGAAMGGFLAETLGWRWEFGIQVPAIALCVVVAYFSTPPALGPMLSRTSQVSQTFVETLLSFDLAGSALLTSSVTFLILALNLGGNMLPWDSPFIILSFVLFFALGTALIYVEHRAAKPVMPLHMLFNKPQGNLIFSNFLACMTMNTILFNLPLYFQAVLLDTPTRSGTRLIVPFLANMVASFATGNFISHSLRFRPTLIFGSVLIVAGSIALTVMPHNLPTALYSWLTALATGGQGFNFPTISIAILAVSHPEDMAVATSTLILFRSLGTVMGVAVSSLVAQNGLNYFLERSVTGPRKSQIIQDVRLSVKAVRGLEGIARDQVINAYALTMRLTFAQGVVTAVAALLLILFVRLPRLNNPKK